MRICIFLMALLGSITASAETSTHPCHVENLETYVQCGTLDTPLDYKDPDGEQISVGFVILPSFNASSTRPPLFFLAGGPGQAATSLAAQIDNMFADARAERDIVLIDQRGTGRSAPLDCDVEPDMGLAAAEDLFDRGILEACVAQLPSGIRHFTTANAIRDFERVRSHLGYTQIDLYGGSYGSRAAFAYLALAGDAVRSVIIDGIAPPDVPIGLFGDSAAAAFERALQRCNANSRCHEAFPDLRADFTQVDAQLRDEPINTQLPHPTTGEITDFRLWHGQFISLIRLLLYSPDTVALLPGMLNAAAEGDYRPLASLMASTTASMDINMLLNLTIVCNEDFPRFSEAAIERDVDNSFGRDTSYRLWSQACPLMPSFPVDLTWMEAGPFPQPALLLSGAGDPVTPPSNGERAAEQFDTQRHIVVENAAHIVASSDCGGDLIAAFLEAQSPDAVETVCVDEIPGQRFVLNPLGLMSSSESGDAS